MMEAASQEEDAEWDIVVENTEGGGTRKPEYYRCSTRPFQAFSDSEDSSRGPSQ